MPAEVVVGHIETVVAWWSGLVEKMHLSFSWCMSSLSAIARYAGTDHIFPVVFPTVPPGYNVIQSKLITFLPTILTDVSIAVKNFKLGHFSLAVGSLNKIKQADH